MSDRSLKRARRMLEEAVLGSDTANARAAKGMWSDLALLKRSSVLAAARSTSKLGTLERAAFQRHLADFQPGERKTSLGLATGHALLVVLQAKAVLALATVVTEWLICAVADTRADAQPRLRRTGTLAAVQQSAYYAMVGLATLAIPSMPWLIPVCLLIAEPGPWARALRHRSFHFGAYARGLHGAMESVRELLRTLRPLVHAAEVSLLLVAWYATLLSSDGRR